MQIYIKILLHTIVTQQIYPIFIFPCISYVIGNALKPDFMGSYHSIVNNKLFRDGQEFNYFG